MRTLCTLAGALWLALAGGCGDDSEGDPADAGLGDAATGSARLAFGRPCDTGEQCESNACVTVTEARAVCSSGCDPEDETTCPMAPNWACLVPNEVDVPVCACQADAAYEVCGDGLDNDCDGFTDNCLVCAGLLVGPGNPDNCGACGRRCAPGSTCEQGECICPDDVPEEECVLDPNAPQCETDVDCDDGIPCTEDVCATGRCVNTVVPARCDAGEVCDLRKGGCVPGKPCATDSDCGDEDPCTTGETCDPATRVCLWTPLDGDFDGQPPRVCGGTDCNDADAATFTGAPERCDGVDNSCNGLVDEPLPDMACGEQQSCRAGACVCDEGLTMCGGVCFDLDEDLLHCGFCGQRCPAGGECNDGQCECPEGTVQCDGACVDTDSDRLHCGGCRNACDATTACLDGTCVDRDECAEGNHGCEGDHVMCRNRTGGYDCVCEVGYNVNENNECVDVDECALASLNDCYVNSGCINNEGGYDCECPAGYSGDGRDCQDVDECTTEDCGPKGNCRNLTGSFTCDCDPGYQFDGTNGCEVANACQAGMLEPEQKWCAGACRTLATDTNNCGDCGVTCTNGICMNGGCTCSDASQTYCPTVGCKDTQNDPAHCSGCGMPCPTLAGCVSGRCVCPINAPVTCNGACVALGTTANCSTCGDACAAGASCLEVSAGVYACQCPAGYPDTCNNVCVNTQTDTTNCGTCGTTCPTGASCNGVACDCPTGQSVCSDTCADLMKSETHCGNCTTSCDVLCNAGTCRVVAKVESANLTTCVLMDDDTVWCWGYRNDGAVGDGLTSGTTDVPQPVAATNVTDLVAAYNHACVVTSNNELRCWGRNNYSQIVAGTVRQSSPVASHPDTETVVVGDTHICVVTTTGAIQCRGSDSWGVHGDGAAVAPNDSWTGPSSFSDPDKLVSGASHVCALKAGEVWCWGYNYYGQLGVGTDGTTDPGGAADLHAPVKVAGLTGVQDLTAGANHTCAIVSGRVKCWGQNSSRQAGVNTNSNVRYPTDVAVTNAVTVHAGSFHTCAKLDDGSITCWGDRGDGRLGDGFSSGGIHTPQTLPGGTDLDALSLGGAHSCAIDNMGDLFCWGDGNYRANGFTGDRTRPSEVTSWSLVP